MNFAICPLLKRKDKNKSSCKGNSENNFILTRPSPYRVNCSYFNIHTIYEEHGKVCIAEAFLILYGIVGNAIVYMYYLKKEKIKVILSYDCCCY